MILPGRNRPAAEQSANLARSFPRRILKFAYTLYYRFFYGNHYPGSGAVARIVQSLETRLGRKDTPEAKERWEEKYRSGRWEYMRELSELPRYATIAGLVNQLRPDGAILDVGCGEGLLQGHLRQLGYARYVGIDLAETAIAQAALRGDERTAFFAADAESFEPDARFDVIVFNEAVNYFHDPDAAVARYERFLAPGGVLIISTFHTPRGEAIMRSLAGRHEVLEHVAVSHRRGTSSIYVFTSTAS